MALPLKYTVRNVLVRRTRTALTILGVALVALVAGLMLAVTLGMVRSMKNSGSPDNVLLLSRKATTTMFSSIVPSDVAPLYSIQGLRTSDENGEPYVSPEVFHGALVTFPGYPGLNEEKSASVRGVTSAAFLVHEQVKMISGEVSLDSETAVVGRLAYVRLGVPEDALAVGRTIRFGERNWKVVGVFAAPGTLMESEIWVDAGELQTTIRKKTYSTISLKLENPALVQDVVQSLKKRTDVLYNAFSETEFYDEYAKTFVQMQRLAMLVTAIMAAGGLFIGLNTMFAAIRSRMQEVASLRVLGFRGRHILVAIVLESMFIAIAGGILACVAVWLFSGVPIRMSQRAFVVEFDVSVLLAMFAMTSAIGLLGGIIPAYHAIRVRVPDALRAG
ncbi:MAG: ABC transporter permease [Planctomycetota bacterium]|nr:ABC transporter permease [Planctomycetota bacterium]